MSNRSSTDVVFVLPEAERFGPGRGGAIATVTREVARFLDVRKMHPIVITPRFKGREYETADVVQLATFGDPTSRLAGSFQKALARLSRSRWSQRSRYVHDVEARLNELGTAPVVFANDPALAVHVARVDPSRQVILWVHNYFTGAEAAASRLLPTTVPVIVVSESVAQWMTDEVGIPRKQITVIHNGVNRDVFFPPARTVGDAGGGDHGPRLRVVCHGRVDPNKGQLLAAQAVELLRDEGLDTVDLTIIGSPQTFGHDPESVKQYNADLAAALASAGGRMTGRVDADLVPALLREFDIACVLPLVPDPCPLAAIEAMASGCAIIAVPLGGVAEIVGDSALNVEPTARAVADAMRRLANDRELLTERRNAAHERSRLFSWDRAAGQLCQVLNA